MRAALLWDLFCTVIDNHGDLGVCWRLSRQLRNAGQRVRLWVDDASALAWMAPNAAQEAGIELRSWQQASDPAALQGLAPADVWVEAFGCHLPEAFVAHGVGSHPRPPAWINLEYLSAENWVPRFHGLSSPVMSGPAKGWTKRFFYPGFTPQTGGLLRERDLLERQSRFDGQAWRAAHGAEPAAGGRLISLFCYESPGLANLLTQLSGSNDLLLVTPGRPLAAVQSALVAVKHKPQWAALPYTSQDGFDQMLWACDLNLVRGEDSLVRALWAGQAFVWHIYPQDDQAHHAKLEAFLDWLQAPPSLRQFHRAWNGLSGGDLPPLDPDTLTQWRLCALGARQRLLAQDDLLAQISQLIGI
jgi:uncharacterized repeat protein (TIGR03837 family)